MSKKFEKLRIDFGRKKASRKDKTWSTGSLLKNSAGEEDFDSSTSGSTLSSENAPSQADSTAETENQDNDGR